MRNCNVLTQELNQQFSHIEKLFDSFSSLISHISSLVCDGCAF